VPSLVTGTPVADALAEWVGIDGVDDSSLIQAGINEHVDPSNPSLFYLQPWCEILPAVQTPITSVALAPGDEVTVTIGQISGSDWGITLTDDTNGESYTTDQDLQVLGHRSSGSSKPRHSTGPKRRLFPRFQTSPSATCGLWGLTPRRSRWSWCRQTLRCPRHQHSNQTAIKCSTDRRTRPQLGGPLEPRLED
jgi:hypothetical protein